MEKKNNISMNLIYFMLLLFPILPQYVYVISNVNILNLILILFIGFFFLINKVKKIEKIYKYMPGMWIYSVICAIRYVVDGDVLKCITYILSFIIIPYIIVQKINTKEKFLRAIDTLIFSGFLLGIFGLIEEVLKYNPLQSLAMENVYFLKEIRYGVFRIATTFGTPIGYGIFQFFILALINYRLSTDIPAEKARKLKIFFGVSLLNLVCTVSRLSIVAYAIFQAIFTLTKSKKDFVKYIFIGFFIMLLVIFTIILFDIKITFLEDLFEIIMQVINGDTAYRAQAASAGDRFRLSSWVVSSVGDSWLFGKGTDSIFKYKVKEGVVKESIENQFLNVYYYTGMIGLIFMVISYISTLKFALKENKKYDNVFGENGWSFLKTMFWVFLIYYIVGLGVQETDMRRLYMIIFSLMICYVKIGERKKVDIINGEYKL